MSVCVENNLWDQAKTDIANMFAYLGVAVTITSLAGGGPTVAGVGIAVSLTGFTAGFIIDYTSPPVQYYECGEVIGLTADDENRIAEDFYLQGQAFGIEQLAHSGDDFIFDFKNFVNENYTITTDEFLAYINMAADSYGGVTPDSLWQLEDAVDTIIYSAIDLYFQDQFAIL